MTKKDLTEQLRSTISSEDAALRERFEKADSVLLRSDPTEGSQVASDPLMAAQTHAERFVHETLTLTLEDRDLLFKLKRSLQALGNSEITRSQIWRAGLQALNRLASTELIDIVGSVERGKRASRAKAPPRERSNPESE